MTSPSKKLAILLILSPLLGFSCRTEPTKPWQAPLVQKPSAVPEKAPPKSSIQKEVFSVEDGESAYKLIVYTIDSSKTKGKVYYENPPLRIEEWQKKLSADLIINGAYFSEEYRPLGFTRINSKTLVDKSFTSGNIGWLSMSAEGKIAVTETLKNPESMIFALQSYPLLIKDGKPHVKDETNKLARRTVLGLNKNHDLVVVMVDQTPISLFKLAQWLHTKLPDLQMALNLDGGSSTGAALKTKDLNETILALSPLPVVIAFSELNPR